MKKFSLDDIQTRGPKTVGIALGSGGGRGWAHLGVLRYLDEVNVRPVFVAGTSAGAIVGAAYACGRAGALEYIAENSDWKFMAKIFGEIGIHRSGLFSGRHAEEFFKKFLTVSKIEDLRYPYAAVATDFRKSAEVVIGKGDLIEAVRASMSIPGVFTPVRHRGKYLVDGGLLNPVPVSVVRAMGADVVIGVDVNLAAGTGLDCDGDEPAGKQLSVFDKSMRKLRTRFNELADANPKTSAALETAKSLIATYSDGPALPEILMQTMRIAENQMTKARLVSDPPDILIQPAVGSISTLDFTRARQCIKAGYEATKAAFATLQLKSPPSTGDRNSNGVQNGQ